MTTRLQPRADLEDLEEQLQLERKKVDVASVSFSARELVRMFAEEELSIAPSYQRQYRWSELVASTFIESIFLGLPIPPIFVATNADFQWEVVDGLQRISSLIMYLAPEASHLEAIGRSTPLTLQGLEKLSQLNGHTYSELPTAAQRYFSRQPLQVISLTDKSDRAVRFDLFERLNSGAISLTAQEVRAVVYRGPFYDFLEELSRDEDLNSLLKLQESNKHDGTQAEQVLKYFAYKNDRASFDGRVTRFLNNYAEKASASFDYTAERELFHRTMQTLVSFTDGPFLRRGTSVTPLVQFEACAVGLAELLQEDRRIRPPVTGWLEDGELVASSTGGTNTRSMLARRVARARELFDGATS